MQGSRTSVSTSCSPTHARSPAMTRVKSITDKIVPLFHSQLLLPQQTGKHFAVIVIIRGLGSIV